MISPALYCAAGGVTQLPQERAAALMQAFRDDSISAILDVSGGDSANAVLPFLDFPAIRAHAKPFFGYSDLSVLLNPGNAPTCPSGISSHAFCAVQQLPEQASRQRYSANRRRFRNFPLASCTEIP